MCDMRYAIWICTYWFASICSHLACNEVMIHGHIRSIGFKIILLHLDSLVAQALSIMCARTPYSTWYLKVSMLGSPVLHFVYGVLVYPSIR